MMLSILTLRPLGCSSVPASLATLLFFKLYPATKPPNPVHLNWWATPSLQTMYIFGQFNRHVLGDLEKPGSSEQRKDDTRPGGRKATTSDSCEHPASNRARSCGRSQLAARAAEPGYRATPLRFTAAMYWAMAAIDDLRSDPDWRHHGWRWCPSTCWKLKVDDILCIMETIWNGNCRSVSVPIILSLITKGRVW